MTIKLIGLTIVGLIFISACATLLAFYFIHGASTFDWIATGLCYAVGFVLAIYGLNGIRKAK